MLRPYQVHDIECLRDNFRKGYLRQMLQQPTGAGKTTAASYMITSTVNRNKKAMFICERITLVEQAAQRFTADGLHVGIVQSNHPDYDPYAPVQVASIQTLARRRHWPEVDIIYIDEAHILHKAHKRIMETWDNIPVIGLSATPWSKGLGKYFQANVANVSINQLITDGYLVPPVVYGPASPDMKGVRTVRGDFEEEGSARESMKIVGDVVNHWIRLADNRPTVMFGVNIAHSKALVSGFVAQGIVAVHIDAYTDRPTRERVFREYREGKIKILSSVDVLGRGWDEPTVGCLCLCRPTRSRIVHFQQIGRGLRRDEGKTDCLVLDFAGNHERLGFVTDPAPTHLDMGEKRDVKKPERQLPLPKPCPKCQYMKPPKVHKCPQCGFAPERQSDVTHEDGELVLVKGKRVYTMVEKSQWFAQIRWICNKHGYGPGWAAHKYRAKFGVWPNHPSIRNVTPIPATKEVLNFIRHEQIRYHKRKEKEART